MQLAIFHQKLCIKNLDDFERDDADTYLWRAELLNVKDKGMTMFLGMFLRGGKVNVVEY